MRDDGWIVVYDGDEGLVVGYVVDGLDCDFWFDFGWVIFCDFKKWCFWYGFIFFYCLMVFGVSGIDDVIVMGLCLYDLWFGLMYLVLELVDVFDCCVSVFDEVIFGGKFEIVMRVID